MSAPARTARILVVANRTPSTPRLLDEVTRRRHESRFTVVVPERHDHRHGADWTPEEARDLVARAACSEVALLDAGADVLDTVHEAVGDGDFDEIIVSTPEEHLARLVHHDLTRRLRRLGLPVVVIPPDPDQTLPQMLESGLPGTYRGGLN